MSNTDSSIHPGAQPGEVIEEYRKEIRENIEYDHLRRQHPYDDIDEIADLMLEVLCTQGSFMRIGGKQLYTALVKERFLKLDSSHIEYVLDRLRESTADIRNIKAYADCFVRSGLLAGASTDQAAGGYISGASASGATILPNDLHSDQGKG